MVATYLGFNGFSSEFNTLLVFENVLEKVFLLNALIRDWLLNGFYIITINYLR